MRNSNPPIGRLGIASLLGVLAGALATFAAPLASAAETAAPCDPATLTCSVGTTSLKTVVKDRLPTQIDTGWMEAGPIKLRSRFSIDPVGADPLIVIDLAKGARVEATWSEAGYVNLKAVTAKDAQGTISAHYTLSPSLEAEIYSVNVAYNASQLVNMLPGARFNYDAKGSAGILPWAFGGGALTVGAPSLDQSTIFSVPFSTLGVSTGVAEGTLSVQAALSPTFNYVTKRVGLDSGVITAADGVAKVGVGDLDFLDLNVKVAGDLSLGGKLQVRPSVKITTVAGYDTFGLAKYSFSAAETTISSMVMPVTFDNGKVHLPLPNVKVPSAAVDAGGLKAGGQNEHTITIDSTGEMAGRLQFESSDPQFTVPTGIVQVPSKTKYDLKVVFKPTSDGPASATITVRSNDPDSPEQSFLIGANGASLDSPGDSTDGPDGKTPKRRAGGIDSLEPLPGEEGCAVANVGAGSANGYLALGLGLGLAAFARRRRSA